jgi:hypothetical protein
MRSKMCGTLLLCPIYTLPARCLGTWKTFYFLKMTAFWDMALYSLTEVDSCFRGVYYPSHQGNHPDDRGSIHL